MSRKKLDDTSAIQVAEDIWWVGFADYEAGFSNNPYLLVDEDEAILIDPGPGHPAFRDVILRKIQQIIDPEIIRYIIVHHQDPDLCGLIPYIENIVHPDAIIIAHPRSTLMLPYYKTRKSILPVGDKDVLILKTGRRIVFHHAPYLHFSGNMMTYDEASRSLFSGDIFAVFNRDWSLYADESYLPLIKAFVNHYMDNKEAVLYAHEVMRGLTIDRILPQHGGVIEGDEYVDKFLNALLETNPGELLRELKNKPDAEQRRALLEAGKTHIQSQSGKDLAASSIEELLNAAMEQVPSVTSSLIETIADRAKAIGVANPLTYGRTHRADAIETVESSKIAEAVRRRYLSRQYGISSEATVDTTDILQYGLMSFKADLGVMFVDIRQFTQWCSDRPPDEIVVTLNKQHELMSKLINANGGRVNKVLGDGLLAYFPDNRLSDCVRVAMEIHEAVADNQLLEVGIGCDFGEVTMGDIGEEARLDYTLIGAPVNFASRMCDSAGPGEIALSHRFTQRLDGMLSEDIRSHPSFQEITVRRKESDPEIIGVRFSLNTSLAE